MIDHIHGHTTVIAEIFVRVKIPHSSGCKLSYSQDSVTYTDIRAWYSNATNSVLLLVLGKSTKYTKLNHVRNFLQLQCWAHFTFPLQ